MNVKQRNIYMKLIYISICLLILVNIQLKKTARSAHEAALPMTPRDTSSIFVSGISAVSIIVGAKILRLFPLETSNLSLQTQPKFPFFTHIV